MQTQQNVLLRTISIIEDIGKLAPTLKADVIKNVTKKQETESRKKYKLLKKELKSLVSLRFNDHSLFSDHEDDKSFKLFKGSRFPLPTQIKQPSAPHLLNRCRSQRLRWIWNWFSPPPRLCRKWLGKTMQPPTDLQNSFPAFPRCRSEFTYEAKKFFEEKVHPIGFPEVIQGNNDAFRSGQHSWQTSRWFG